MIQIFNENFFYLESGLTDNVIYNRIYTSCFIYFNSFLHDYFIGKFDKNKVELNLYHFEKYNKVVLEKSYKKVPYQLTFILNKFFVKKASFSLVTNIYKYALSCGNIKKTNLPKKFQNLC
jgi:hypothetical protein